MGTKRASVGSPDQRVQAREVDVVGQAHDVARGHVGAQEPAAFVRIRISAPSAFSTSSGRRMAAGSPCFVVMGAAAEDGDALAFELAHDEVGAVARDAGVGEARQVGIGDGVAVDALRQMAEAGAEDEAHRTGAFRPGMRADPGGEVSAFLDIGLSARAGRDGAADEAREDDDRQDVGQRLHELDGQRDPATSRFG
jgi:hypothetical protein